MVFLKAPPDAYVAVAHTLDGQTAPRIECLREHLMQQRPDRIRSHCRSRHGRPLAGQSGALVLDGTTIRSIVDLTPSKDPCRLTAAG
jgi:hypothetical protein